MLEKANANVLAYCEDKGIVEPYRIRNNLLTYYTLYDESPEFPKGRFYRVTVNCGDNREIERRPLRYKKVPKFLKGKYGNRYNYKVG